MAVAGDTMPANMVKMQDGVPIVKHRENRPSSVLVSDLDTAETTLRSGLTVWVPSSLFLDLRSRMMPQGALVDVPKQSKVGRVIYDDEPAAAPRIPVVPVYDGTCAEQHDRAMATMAEQLDELAGNVATLRDDLIRLLESHDLLKRTVNDWRADS